jgi:hypothetical protein
MRSALATARRALLLALLTACSAGCTARFEAFAFRAPDGASVAITQSRRPPRGQEARFPQAAGAAASPVYRLAAPVAVSAPRQAFGLSYTGSLTGCTLTILSDRRTAIAHAVLPRAGDTRLRFLVPLERGARVWGWQLTASGGAQGSITLAGAGVGPFVHGFSIDGEELSVDGSVEVLSASAQGVEARITRETMDEMRRGIWLLGLATRDGAADGRAVFESEDGRSAAFAVEGTGPLRLDFARGSMEFLPAAVRFEGGLRSLDISQVPAEAPIPADPGTILTWDRSAWRKPDFELFSWTRFPRVLILDIATYDVQDALLRRIAFFVEKAGHAGRVEPAAALQGLHGYNAHDYRAEDLARFFNAAGKAPGGLSIEEKGLAQLLVDNGLLRQAADGFQTGDGCILSISRESAPYLRDLLLTHECFHGAYFSLPGFREATEAEWGSLSTLERDVWVDYLASHAYNTADRYLVANEFQSYLMQQPREGVNGFQAVTLTRMRAHSAQSARLARELAAARPTAFLDQFDVLDRALRAAGGLSGGRAFAVRRAEK